MEINLQVTEGTPPLPGKFGELLLTSVRYLKNGWNPLSKVAFKVTGFLIYDYSV